MSLNTWEQCYVSMEEEIGKRRKEGRKEGGMKEEIGDRRKEGSKEGRKEGRRQRLKRAKIWKDR